MEANPFGSDHVLVNHWLFMDKNMIPSIDIGANHATHKFKLCSKCDTYKPPEGGIEMGHKWNCQYCWLKRITGVHLKQNRIDGGKNG